MGSRGIVDRVAIRNALVSVSDKAGLPALVQALGELGGPISLYSTGGTYRELADLVPVPGALRLQRIEDYTGYPEMPGGLVKTLHPRVHGGLLGDLDDPAQRAHMDAQGMVAFDLVVVNLYPFERTVATPGAGLEAARQQIDIGGPTMLRAAAKNFPRVAVVVDPADYMSVAGELAARAGTLGLATRWELARKAFRHVLAYDRAIAEYLDSRDMGQLRQAYDAR